MADYKEEFKMTFGEKLKEARKKAGLSQEQFAEKMNVSRSAIAKWETDKGMPDVNNLKVMSQLLNVSIDYLLDEDEKISFNEMKEAIHLYDYVENAGKVSALLSANNITIYQLAQSGDSLETYYTNLIGGCQND